MKNILIITPFFSPNIGGAETFTDELIKELLKCNHKITVLTFQPFKTRLPKLVIKERLLVYRMNWWLKQPDAWKGISLRNVLSVIPQLVFGSISLCLKNKYNIIHAQGLLSGFVAILLKKIFKKKVFITLLALYGLNEFRGIKLDILKFILRNCNCLFVEGQNGYDDLPETHLSKKIIKFQHWVDQRIFTPPERRVSKDPMYGNKLKVLFVGRPIPEKGLTIVKQAEIYISRHTGFPPMEFTYVENVTQQELAKLYQMADVCIVPSLYSEGYSRVVAEAASCGCAIVTSNRGSLPEMVKDFGLSVEPTPEKIACAIPFMYLEQLQEKALSYAKLNFSSKNSEVFTNAYAE